MIGIIIGLGLFFLIILFISLWFVSSSKSNPSLPLTPTDQLTQTASPEVFYYGGKNSNWNLTNQVVGAVTYPQAEAACNEVGATLATVGQVYNAYVNGADWCAYGLVRDYNSPVIDVYGNQYVETFRPGGANQDEVENCQNEFEGINTNNDPNILPSNANFGVLCYGVKPPKPTPPNFTTGYITFFNGGFSDPNSKWSQYDN